MIDINPEENIEPIRSILMALLQSQIKSEPTLRIYSYVLAQEETSKGFLKMLGFYKEVELKEHVFVKGYYCDLEIWGTQRGIKS
jgi:RimJ/RimL family protein N-acetyltransferase